MFVGLGDELIGERACPRVRLVQRLFKDSGSPADRGVAVLVLRFGRVRHPGWQGLRRCVAHLAWFGFLFSGLRCAVELCPDHDRRASACTAM
jgi:hypothetical protein